MKNKFKSWIGKEIPRKEKNDRKIKRLKESAIRNIITSDFEIKEGLKIAFDNGYREGINDLKKVIKKYWNTPMPPDYKFESILKKIEKYLNKGRLNKL